MLQRVREVAAMPPAQRRAIIRRRADHELGRTIFGGAVLPLARHQRFAYISYIPDAIREYGKRPDFKQVVSWWTHKNARRNCGDIPRLLLLLANVDKILDERVPGHFAELGVYKGNSARILAEAIGRQGSARKLYLFDTFGGFDERDRTGIDANVRVQFTDVSLETVQEFVGNGAVCRFRPGYFPESAADLPTDESFALVHLDADLYEPMKAGLDFFYPRMNPGGMMILHDYSSGHWPGATKAVDEFLCDKPERLVMMPDKSGTAIFRKL